jgi:hypothetical protein
VNGIHEAARVRQHEGKENVAPLCRANEAMGRPNRQADVMRA